jgi:hypothetical protein
MSVNKYKPHIWVIPEDDANRQLVNGFLQHSAVHFRAVGISKPAGGWQRVLDVFEEEFVQHLRNYSSAFLVMVIDFDESVEDRRSICEQRIPEDLKSRVFLIGSSDEPERLRVELNMSFEAIGEALARDCDREDLGRWGHPHLSHNLAELQRMLPDIKRIIFQGG